MGIPTPFMSFGGFFLDVRDINLALPERSDVLDFLCGIRYCFSIRKEVILFIIRFRSCIVLQLNADCSFRAVIFV